MYLAAEALRFPMKDKENALAKQEVAVLNTYKAELDRATRFIPIWVKVAVAIALGQGTMIGWKRIAVTVGEKIGKSHLTYAQGASTSTDCRYRGRTSCPRVSRAPWPPTARACRWRRYATC
jgi:PiT family inorganic phosphate transporter